MEKGGYLYILTNKRRTVLYIGVTSNLKERIYEHKNKRIPGFTAKYNLDQLVYFERFDSIENAICREKQLKGKTRIKKNSLITSLNASWRDLSYLTLS